MLSAQFLGVVKFGITRRLGRRDRRFESGNLGLGAAIRLATEPVSKTDELNRLVGSTPTRSALRHSSNGKTSGLQPDDERASVAAER